MVVHTFSNYKLADNNSEQIQCNHIHHNYKRKYVKILSTHGTSNQSAVCQRILVVVISNFPYIIQFGEDGLNFILLSDFLYFVQAKTVCRYGCMYFLATLVLVRVDVMVMPSA